MKYEHKGRIIGCFMSSSHGFKSYCFIRYESWNYIMVLIRYRQCMWYGPCDPYHVFVFLLFRPQRIFVKLFVFKWLTLKGWRRARASCLTACLSLPPFQIRIMRGKRSYISISQATWELLTIHVKRSISWELKLLNLRIYWPNYSPIQRSLHQRNLFVENIDVFPPVSLTPSSNWS
jgi:hypothetical protein